MPRFRVSAKCPENKGIETILTDAIEFDADWSAKCPENKGIETGDMSAYRGAPSSAKCPENKGIETGDADTFRDVTSAKCPDN